MEEVKRYKPLFLISLIAMAALLLWHLVGVTEAAKATGDTFITQTYLMLVLGGLMLCLLAGLLLFTGKLKFETCWIIAFAFLGIISLRVLPGLSAPDEPVHYVTAYRLSNQLMFVEPNDESGRVYIRARDFALEDVYGEIDLYEAGLTDGTSILGQYPDESLYHQMQNWTDLHPADAVSGGDSEGAPVGMVASNQPWLETTPIVYIPQALGITAARILGLSSVALVTVGRLFNLAAFIVLVYLALKLMPFGKEIMAASTMLPMTVHLAASMSYDTMLIALVYVFIALVLRLAYKAERVEWKDIIILAGILAIISPCKLVYGVIIFLLLMIPKRKFMPEKTESETENADRAAADRTYKRKLILMWVICGVVMIGSLLAVNAAVIGRFAAAEESELAWAGEQGWTITYALHRPVEVIKIVINTLAYQCDYYHQTLIGAWLGNVDEVLEIPYAIVMLLSVLLLITGLRPANDGNRLSGRDKIIGGAVAAVLFGLLMGSMLIGWTPLSSLVILGVQGRYLLPVLPLIILLISNKYVVVSRDLSKECIYLMLCCNVFAFVRMYSMIVLHV